MSDAELPTVREMLATAQALIREYGWGSGIDGRCNLVSSFWNGLDPDCPEHEERVGEAMFCLCRVLGLPESATALSGWEWERRRTQDDVEALLARALKEHAMSETQSQPAGLTPEQRAQRVSALLEDLACSNCHILGREIEQHALALADAAVAAEARIAVLEQALQPFAECAAQNFSAGLPPEETYLWVQQKTRGSSKGITLAHVLAARVALGIDTPEGE